MSLKLLYYVVESIFNISRKIYIHVIIFLKIPQNKILH